MTHHKVLKSSLLFLLLALVLVIPASAQDANANRIIPLGIYPVEEALARFCLDVDAEGNFVANNFEALLVTAGPDEAVELLVNRGLSDEETALAFVEEVDAALTLPTVAEAATQFYYILLTYCYGEEIWQNMPVQDQQVSYDYWIEYFGWTEEQIEWWVYYYEFTYSEYYMVEWLIEQGVDIDQVITDFFYAWHYGEEGEFEAFFEQYELSYEEFVAEYEESTEQSEVSDVDESEEFADELDDMQDEDAADGEDTDGDGDEDTGDDDAGDDADGDEDTGEDTDGDEDTGEDDADGDDADGDDAGDDEDAGDDGGEDDGGDEDAGDDSD